MDLNELRKDGFKLDYLVLLNHLFNQFLNFNNLGYFNNSFNNFLNNLLNWVSFDDSFLNWDNFFLNFFDFLDSFLDDDFILSVYLSLLNFDDFLNDLINWLNMSVFN